MNIKWILVIMGIALGVSIIQSLPENMNTLVEKDFPADHKQQVISKKPVTAFDLPTRQTGQPLSISSSPNHQPEQSTDTEATADQTAEQNQPVHNDAFPEIPMPGTDQIAEQVSTDETILEAERSSIDLYFPVDETTVYEPGEDEKETQRLALEEEIARQTMALEQQQLSDNENDFEMPPL